MVEEALAATDFMGQVTTASWSNRGIETSAQYNPTLLQDFEELFDDC